MKKTIETKKAASVNEAIEIINRLNYRNDTFEYHGYTREDNADIKYRHFDGYKENGEPDGFSLIEIVVGGKLEVVRFFNHFRNITVDIKLGDFNPDYSRYDEVIDADAQIENNAEVKAEVEMVEDERNVFSLLPSIDELNDVEISEPEIETPSTDTISSEVKINAVASYTLSAMCEEEAIRTEEEIEEAIEQNELVKSLKSQKAKASKKATKKMTETERQQKWLENAKVSDSNKYYIVPELDYKGVEANSNWKPCFYIVTNDLKLTRISLKFAVELAALGKAIEVSKAQVATFKNNAKKAA